MLSPSELVHFIPSAPAESSKKMIKYPHCSTSVPTLASFQGDLPFKQLCLAVSICFFLFHREGCASYPLPAPFSGAPKLGTSRQQWAHSLLFLKHFDWKAFVLILKWQKFGSVRRSTAWCRQWSWGVRVPPGLSHGHQPGLPSRGLSPSPVRAGCVGFYQMGNLDLSISLHIISCKGWWLQ